ncbi:hypothetical protein ACROYT_G041906 [Oculina patagonica]
MATPRTSEKHRAFINGPIGTKGVTALAGIGDTYGKRLEAQGINKAYVVLGHFLVLEKDKVKFKNWINEKCGATESVMLQCFEIAKLETNPIAQGVLQSIDQTNRKLNWVLKVDVISNG